MKIYEIRCGSNTILRINYTTESPTEVVQSHTLSYLQAREMFKRDLKQTMGLDELIKNELKWNVLYVIRRCGFFRS